MIIPTKFLAFLGSCSIQSSTNGWVPVQFSHLPTGSYPNQLCVRVLGDSNQRVLINYSLRSRFRKITLFLNFQLLFVHFAKNQTRPLFLSKFSYYLIFEPKKWFRLILLIRTPLRKLTKPGFKVVRKIVYTQVWMETVTHCLY